MKFDLPFTLFHGSMHAQKWVEQLRRGTAKLLPRGKAGHGRMKDAWLQPMKDRIYLTPREDDAVLYAHGARWTADTWSGVVLKVLVEPGQDVLPDEDCVGTAVGYAFDMPSREICGGEPFEMELGLDVESDLRQAVRAMAERGLTAKEIAAIETSPDVRVIARYGKKLMPHLTTEITLALIAAGANLAVKPPVTVLGGWYIAETDSVPNDAALLLEEESVWIPNASA